MRLTIEQRRLIKEQVRRVFGETARVMVFGSRTRDDIKGGDIDLLVQVDHPLDHPALDAARLSAALSRAMEGRKVDVLLRDTRLKELPIHRIAEETGIAL